MSESFNRRPHVVDCLLGFALRQPLRPVDCAGAWKWRQASALCRRNSLSNDRGRQLRQRLERRERRRKTLRSVECARPWLVPHVPLECQSPIIHVLSLKPGQQSKKSDKSALYLMCLGSTSTWLSHCSVQQSRSWFRLDELHETRCTDYRSRVSSLTSVQTSQRSRRTKEELNVLDKKFSVVK